MSDPIETLMALRDHLETLLAEADTLAEKHKRERAEFDEKVAIANRKVAIASGVAALRAASTDCRHESVRVQVRGARELLQRELAG